MAELIIPLIMCGGAGTRLWPASREGRPKQFLPLFGPHSTFQDTLKRVSDRSVFDRAIIITNSNYRFLVAEQLAEIGVEADIILEPLRRDSGPAILAGTAFAMRRDADPIILALAADHRVTDTAAFVTACRFAGEAAERGHIVAFGVRPDRPATEYGYIQTGEAVDGNVFAVEKFVEKPDQPSAARFVSDGYLWNSGNFVFRASVVFGEYRKFDAAAVDAACSAVEIAGTDLGFVTLSADAFGRAKANSIDYAVMEKTRLAAVVPVSYRWSDVGSWHAVWELSDKDSEGNASQGSAIFAETQNCYALSDKALVSLFGVKNLVVVATEDAVLIADRENTAGMKRLVERLKQVAPGVTVDHLKVHRPWGDYQSLDHGDRYQVKRIVVKEGGRLSLQFHKHRAEHWVVVRGTAKVTIGNEVKMLQENESIYIPLGAPHRLENPGKIPLELIEVQTGSYLGEDDIVRVEDDYHRS